MCGEFEDSAEFCEKCSVISRKYSVGNIYLHTWYTLTAKFVTKLRVADF